MSLTESVLPVYPSTRYMGSKQAILADIWNAVSAMEFETVLDAFSGSGCVSHMFKLQGKQVFSNDYLVYNYSIAKAVVENNTVRLTDRDVELLLRPNPTAGTFVQQTFRGLYFSDEENRLIDNVLANIHLLEDDYRRSLARVALSRACLKKRPRGVFTYVGQRYVDGRQDLRLSLEEHFVRAIRALNSAIYDNGKDNRAYNRDVFELEQKADLVYLDPPYFTPHSDNDYLRRYHFLEGLCCEWKGVTILNHTKTKKLKKYPTPFDSRRLVYGAFERLFDKFKDSIIVLSYSSNGIPNKEELQMMLRRVKDDVRLIKVNHVYSFGTHAHKKGNRNNVAQEYLFIAT